ncbi:hypothetical protein HNQ51_003705 [Inhella inkyongensis]|uniref:DUF4238 domain-containing protein n=1 Tax=Inhella inkyongensis TaxID=392593 RepID=A0A840SDI9_9BURK|nr:DUF4238 domain-containing protein [Inhella inkyongensis]MBB5206359.1 hypothetical protein [Inhella inkyongensis]
MATNKNQHFVPRCHLRPFTKDEGDASINVFNLDRRKLIANAPVKNQCSRDYFYGKDALLETAIASLERAYGATVRAIRTPGYSLREEHKVLLRRFWLFQSLRTEAASSRAVEMSADLQQFAGEGAASFRLDIKQAVQTSMRVFADAMDAVEGLKVCLVRNRTSLPFITSDDPAVLTNRWYLEDKRASGRSFGWQSAGALALLPLTPKVLCIAYDGDVYSIQHDRGWAETRREEDVLAFNQHQLLNCFANVYLHDATYSPELSAQYDVASARRLPSRRAFHVAVFDRIEGEYTRYRVVTPEEANACTLETICHSETLHCSPTLWPALVRWRTPGSVFTNGTGVKYVRREVAATMQSHRDFWREDARRA